MAAASPQSVPNSSLPGLKCSCFHAPQSSVWGRAGPLTATAVVLIQRHTVRALQLAQSSNYSDCLG